MGDWFVALLPVVDWRLYPTVMSAEDLARPPCLREDALAVLRRLREAGNVAYFAGGCVRDVLLKLDPKD